MIWGNIALPVLSFLKLQLLAGLARAHIHPPDSFHPRHLYLVSPSCVYEVHVAGHVHMGSNLT